MPDVVNRYPGKEGNERHGTPTPSRCAFALLTAMAVLAMHGPTAGHALAMPSSSMAAAVAPSAERMSRAHVLRMQSLARAASCTDAMMVMGHSDCVATLRRDAGQASAAITLVVADPPAPAETVGAHLARHDRAPPPSLIGLCVSRT